MKIVDKRVKTNIFELVKIGQCFMVDNQLFIKVGFFNEEEGGEVFNCICLNDGSFCSANYDDEIEIVNAEIIIN